ncbi:galactokinase [Flagellimonas pacifica]|uniref:Galactokinase n=1 Tax=Flagellimonas pacifica TaxID=1247520 RepID=A0A285MYJ6_9FLAO|nr:galactokinase [Allomuricauda parva]SNZ01743.1 galactokinase [Allomuricauda parva]
MKIETKKHIEPKPRVQIVSPGRINLIGEHTDYNNGYVLPAAIDKCIFFKIEKNGSKFNCTITSDHYPDALSVDLRAIKKSEITWENYILGVLDELLKGGKGIEGFDCMIKSELPIGSGLSSSAALECGLTSGLNELFQLGMTKEEIALLSQAAEHNFVGTKCGIMDQFASVFGKQDHVIRLDCKSRKYKYISAELDPYAIILLNSNVAHQLASSEYNTRRLECEKGVAIIRENFPNVESLRDVDLDMLEYCSWFLDDVVFNRCSFVLAENKRVLAAANALKKCDLVKLGSLLYQSHEGLRDLYDVSCAELDFLVEYSKRYKEVLGARLMGGGFGGCTLNLVHKDAVTNYLIDISQAYFDRFNIELTPIEIALENGTKIKTSQ